MPILKAILLVFFMGLSANISAKDKKKDEPALDSKSKLELNLGFTWHDALEGEGRDPAPDSKTPDFSISGESSFFDKNFKDASFILSPTIVWEFGGSLHAKSPNTSEPYLIIGEVSGKVDLGAEFKFYLDEQAKLTIFPYVGLEVLDQTDADFDFVPVGAASQDFWFRTVLEGGLKLGLDLKFDPLASLGIDLKAKVFSDLENAYGRKPTQGFKLGMGLNPQFTFAKTASFQMELNPELRASYDTGMVIQELKFRADLPLKFVIGDAASFNLGIVNFEFDSKDMAANFFNASDLSYQCASSLAIIFGPSKNAMTLGLQVPWLAYDAGHGGFSEISGLWQLSFKYQIEL